MIENLTQRASRWRDSFEFLILSFEFGGFYRGILVYAYILMYCFKELGFENEGFENRGYLKEGFVVEVFLFLATPPKKGAGPP